MWHWRDSYITRRFDQRNGWVTPGGGVVVMTASLSVAGRWAGAAMTVETGGQAVTQPHL